MISIHDPQLETTFRRAHIDPQQLHLLRRHYLRQCLPWSAAVGKLSAVAQEICSTIAPNVLQVEDRFASSRDGATRLVFKNRQGHRLESVLLRIASGRTSLCLSTQVGCAVRCGFCATGQMGLVTNLSVAEILDQVVLAGQLAAAESRRLRNLVFMGMGEPLHNEENLYGALDQLVSAKHFAFAPQRITVSTVGLPDAMRRLCVRFPRIRIALSLHSARQQVRERLIPIARRHSLDELREAMEAVTQRGEKLLIEYLMLDGWTDTDEDVHALSDYLADVSVHLNLIPLNPIDGVGAELRPSSAQRLTEFAAELRNRGFPVTIRYSLGGDVAGACGQLVQRRNRQHQFNS